MTTDTTTLPTLDRDDLKALRTADTVCFRHTPEGSTIECTKKEHDEFGDKERRRDIAVLGTVFNGYDEDGGRARGATMNYGFAMFGSAKYTEQWHTVVQLLRVGDTLRLEFRTDDATNGYVKDAHLHADELYLRVERGDGPTRKRFYFLLDVSICPSNSARMCKEYRI
jgi:hypothetical protein